MSEREIVELRAQMAALTQERDLLLDELETAYKQMEEHLHASERERDIAYGELRERNRELQQRLEELERTHQELRETQRMLIRSERLAAMGEMAAAIVHEIKNPLAVVQAQMSWILSRDEAPTRKSLEIVMRAGDRLARLVENVLGFARNHRGNARDLDLNAVLTDLEALVKPIVRSAALELDLKPGLPRVLADPGQIEQVLMNLVVNALDAVGKKGRVRLVTSVGCIQASVEEAESAGRPHVLAIEAAEEDRQRACVCAEVHDNGSGIPEAALEQVFQAFFTTKGERKGTGLGLSIARTIVQEWEGNILVSSAVGEGTCFRVFLPLEAQA